MTVDICVGARTIETVRLLDERSSPDFGELYARHARDAVALDAAVSRVRLGGMTLGQRDLGELRQLRLLVGEMNALVLTCEIEALAIDPRRRERLSFIAALLHETRLQVRVAPLAGWDPDFSIFRGRDDDRTEEPSLTALIGPHWFERPYPHPGPAVAVAVSGHAILPLLRRFEETWRHGHDLRRPLLDMLRDGLRRQSATPS